MKLNAPKFITWLIALILGVVGLLAEVGVFAFIPTPWGLIILVAGFVLLLLATVLKGL
jgi:hypothetical protein